MKRNQTVAVALMAVLISAAGCPASDSDEAHKSAAAATQPAAKTVDPPAPVPAPAEAAAVKPEAAPAAAPAALAAPAAAPAPAAPAAK